MHRALIHRFDDGFQLGAIIGIETLISPENLIRNWLFLAKVTCWLFDRAAEQFRGGSGADILSAAEAIGRRPVEWGPRIFAAEHVQGFVPSSAQNVTSTPGCIPAPLLDVARHVIGSIRAKARVTPHLGGASAFPFHVARLQDV